MPQVLSPYADPLSAVPKSALPTASGASWTFVSAPQTMAAGGEYYATAACNLTVPACAAGDMFTVAAGVDNVRVAHGACTISDAGAGNDILLLAGEEVQLIATAANTLKVL